MLIHHEIFGYFLLSSTIRQAKTRYSVQKATIEFNYFSIVQERWRQRGELKVKFSSDSIEWL